MKKIGMSEEEKQIHGTKWSNVLEGHFFNKNVSFPFIKFITEKLVETTPDIVVDIGGGTGFLLNQLINNGIDEIKKDIKLINIDMSEIQITNIINKRIIGYESSAINFSRSLLDKNDDKKITFIMRYVLHYFGPNVIKDALTNIRSQMKTGELLIHHTLCTDTEEDGIVINYFYRNFAGIYNKSHKWIPSFQQIEELLNSSGFIIANVKNADLASYSQDILISRYKITKKDIDEIKNFTKNNLCKLYREDDKGIILDLPSRYLSCKAI